MPDLLMAFGAMGTDLVLHDGDLGPDTGLYTAIVISLFTDRLAEHGDELPPGQTDPRGWCLDVSLPRIEGRGADRIGSRLWLLQREKELPEVLARARHYAREALQWLVDEGHVQGLVVDATAPSRGHLRITVNVDRNAEPRETLTFLYNYAAARREE